MYAEAPILDRVLRRARRSMLGRFYLDRSGVGNTVFLAGTGRSGTTWVAHVLNFDNRYRLMFEPFNSESVEIIGHFRYRQYLRSDNRNPAFLEPAAAILSGTVRNGWIDQINRKILVHKRLIKDIRAHHLLKWIKTQFPEIRMVLLMGHPCAVAHSKLQLGWETDLSAFLSQEELMQDFLAPFRDLLSKTFDPFEKHVIAWCVENYVPLCQFNEGEIHLLFYERLCADPEAELGPLFSFLGEKYDSRVHKAVRRPSSLCRTDSPILTGRNPVDSWTAVLSRDKVKRAVRVLSTFKLDGIYNMEPMPNHEVSLPLETRIEDTPA